MGSSCHFCCLTVYFAFSFEGLGLFKNLEVLSYLFLSLPLPLSHRPACSKHCLFVIVVVLVSDHHCALLNCCVGSFHYRIFLLFLAHHAATALWFGWELGKNVLLRSDASLFLPSFLNIWFSARQQERGRRRRGGGGSEKENEVKRKEPRVGLLPLSHLPRSLPRSSCGNCTLLWVGPREGERERQMMMLVVFLVIEDDDCDEDEEKEEEVKRKKTCFGLIPLFDLPLLPRSSCCNRTLLLNFFCLSLLFLLVAAVVMIINHERLMEKVYVMNGLYVPVDWKFVLKVDKQATPKSGERQVCASIVPSFLVLSLPSSLSVMILNMCLSTGSLFEGRTSTDGETGQGEREKQSLDG